MRHSGTGKEADWVEKLGKFLREKAGVVESDGILGSLEKQLETENNSGTHRPVDGLPGPTPRNEARARKTTSATAEWSGSVQENIWPDSEEALEEAGEEWKTMAWLAGICGSLMAAAFSLSFVDGVADWVVYGLYGLSLLSGGWDAAKDSYENIKKGSVDIHFLMLAVAVGAVAIGSWAEGALLLFLFSLSGALEDYAEHRTHREIDSLTRSAPKTANRVGRDGSIESVAVEDIVPGDVIQVKPDELFPIDGEVTSGMTASDESTLTGEATPVEKGRGDLVFSGTLNLWGVVMVKVLRLASESALQKIIRLIQEARHLRAPSQRFTDRFGTGYTYLIIGLTLLYFLFSWMFLGIPAFERTEAGYSAFYRAMTFLVVASPCALVLSIPSAILAAIAWGARKGILFRGGAAIEKLAQVNAVALDKTGTLTQGDLSVLKVESFPPGRENEVFQLAFSLESQSNHPIARAIVNHGKKQGLATQKVGEFQSFSGRGLRGQVEEKSIFLGRRELLKGSSLADWIAQVDEPPPSITEVWLFHRALFGRVLLEDKIREKSKDTLERLNDLGIKTLMLTGDRRSAAEAVGEAIGIQEIRSGLMPRDKVMCIKEMTDRGDKVAMVGDGVNDAPSLAAAFVAVSMGARGSDAALEQSEVILMNDKIEKFLTAYQLSRKARSVIRQNLIISIATVAVMASAALLGIIPLTLGVFVHEGSTVVVCLNSLRLLIAKEE